MPKLSTVSRENLQEFQQNRTACMEFLADYYEELPTSNHNFVASLIDAYHKYGELSPAQENWAAFYCWEVAEQLDMDPVTGARISRQGRD